MSNPKTDIALYVTRTFTAPPERVFRAWTDAEAVKGWFGPHGSKTVLAEIDLRVGGRYRFGVQSPDGYLNYVSGTYRAIQIPTRLVFTWGWSNRDNPDPDEMMLVTVAFQAHGVGTQVTLTQEHLPSEMSKEQHTAGWVESFEQLEQVLSEGR